MDRITLAHGSGGKATYKLIKEIFFKYFANEILLKEEDSAVVPIEGGKIAFTTDSFVVKPIFFPGGDIGKIAISGSVNDVAVLGAKPKYISVGFIIEEGLPLSDLELIADSMAKCAHEAGVKIVAGDTKVVGKGEADKMFITTSAIGTYENSFRPEIEMITPGDIVIVSGTIGDHGISVLSSRKGLEFEADIESDAAPLNNMIHEVLEGAGGVKFMRDPTRGGVAATLNEIVRERNFGITIEEKSLPVKDSVKGACELLGLDPLYVANEGKALFIVKAEKAEDVLNILKKNKYGKSSTIIGSVNKDFPGKVCINTILGVTRIVDMPRAEQLPRIC